MVPSWPRKSQSQLPRRPLQSPPPKLLPPRRPLPPRTRSLPPPLRRQLQQRSLLHQRSLPHPRPRKLPRQRRLQLPRQRSQLHPRKLPLYVIATFYNCLRPLNVSHRPMPLSTSQLFLAKPSQDASQRQPARPPPQQRRPHQRSLPQRRPPRLRRLLPPLHKHFKCMAFQACKWRYGLGV